MAKPLTTVEIPCPRCDGKGSRQTWKPDAGICYRCKGHCTVTVRVEKSLAALRHLRAKYVALKQESTSPDPEVAEMARERLRYCVEDGLRLRADLEAAGVSIPA